MALFRCFATLSLILALAAVAAAGDAEPGAAAPPPQDPEAKAPEDGTAPGGAPDDPKEGKEPDDGSGEPPPPPPLDAETRAVLDLLDKTHEKIQSLEAPFAQVRKVRISRKLRKAKGTLYVRKGTEEGGLGMEVLFVETEPFRSKVLFTDKEVVYLDEESGEVKRQDPRQGGVKPSEIWVLGRRASEIEKHYAASLLAVETPEEAERYLGILKLVPRSENLRKWVREVRVWMRKSDALGVKVRITDKTGDYQEFSFDEERLRINPELEDVLFVIE